MVRTLLNNDVVFFCPSVDPSAYAKYGTTMVASGASHASDYVNKLKRQNIHSTGTAHFLSINSHDTQAHPELANAFALDIEQKPIPVPWIHHEATSYFGCVNNPAFRAYGRSKVCEAMASGPQGLHIDEYLGSAYAAVSDCGCFCPHCIHGFAQYLSKLNNPDLLSLAKADTFDGFEYLAFVKTITTNTPQYISLLPTIPLHDEFIDFQLQCATANALSMAALAADIVDSAVTLSATISIPSPEYLPIVPHLSYCVSNIDHEPQNMPKGLLQTVKAYRFAEALQKPLAATATPENWAFINSHNADNLACVWIALANACGQVFMAPNRILCSAIDNGPHWFCGSAATFAPLYQFIKNHGGLLNDFKAVGPLSVPLAAPTSFDTTHKRQTFTDAINATPISPIMATDTVWVFPRMKSDGAIAIHIVNLAFDLRANRNIPAVNVEVHLPNSLFKRDFSGATVHSCNSEPYKIQVTNNENTCTFVLPEVKLWDIVTFEYWA